MDFFLFLSFSLALKDSAAAAGDSAGNKSEGRQAEWNGNFTFLSHDNYDVVIRNIFYEFLSTSLSYFSIVSEEKDAPPISSKAPTQLPHAGRP